MRGLPTDRRPLKKLISSEWEKTNEPTIGYHKAKNCYYIRVAVIRRKGVEGVRKQFYGYDAKEAAVRDTDILRC